MSAEELYEAVFDGDKDEVERLVDEEGVDVNSKDRVSVCVLCLLILVLFGIGWNYTSHVVFLERPLGRGTRAAGSRSEPIDQEHGK